MENNSIGSIENDHTHHSVLNSYSLIHLKMPRIHKLKRLNHHHGHGEHLMIKNWPSNNIDEDLINRKSKYVKYFDYPLAQLLTDHSTNPLQNTARQHIDKTSDIRPEGRFVNHEMIIRRNGETTILRPRQDLVLANGFTPVIRPSSILPSYHSIISHSSLSIMNKMSMKKCESTSIIKSKQKTRHHQKRCHQINNSSVHSNEYNKPNVIHLIEQALHELVEQKIPQPPPLMSILPQFHNQSLPPRLEDPYLNQPPFPRNQSFYDYPFPKQYHNFQGQPQSCFNSPPLEHYHQRNYTHMSGYFLH